MTQVQQLDPVSIQDEEVVNVLRAEIAMRERVYPRWLNEGRIKPAEAAVKLAAMRRALQIVLDATSGGRLL